MPSSHVHLSHLSARLDDLISGKVKEIRLQPDRTDQFAQRYTYEHDQRNTSVATSRDGIMWEHEASHEYFAYGPLKRLELSQACPEHSAGTPQ